MWDSLPALFELLVNDCIRQFGFPQTLRLLDVGCGTGLAFSSLLKTQIGDRIASIDLLDTSPAMLERARQRASLLQIPLKCHQGLLGSLLDDLKYDLIVTCSVLHHLPQIPEFLQQVRSHQAKRGIFLHLQDPNGDYLADRELQERMTLAAKRPLPEFCYRLAPARIARRIKRTIFRSPADDYIAKTNRALLRAGMIATSLTVPELFAITDIHVQDGQGVSISQMKSWMTEYECVAQRSYGFFGQLWSTLPRKLKEQEQRLIASRAPNGFHIGAAWRLR
jgi:SAM-dependent methyltransferase